MHDTNSSPVRRYNFKKVLNLRDLGGYCTDDERITRYLTFFRSDALTHIQQAELDLLKRKGLSTVIDLRTAMEANEDVHPCRFSHDIDYYNISIIPEITDDFTPSDEITLGDTYVSMLENRSGIAQVFRILASAKGSVLYHCAAGKDRTGVITALLLLLSGVSTTDVIADYQVSYEYIRPNFDDKDFPWNVMNFIRSDAENMHLFIKTLKAMHNGAREYLLSAGVSEEDLKTIADKFLI